MQSARVSGLTFRHAFFGSVVLIFVNWLATVILSNTASEWRIIADLLSVGIFQYMAWYVIFRLLHSRASLEMADSRHILIIAGICTLLLLPLKGIIWIAGTGIAAVILVSKHNDPNMRAAGIVLAALSVQEFWGQTVFQLISFPLLQAETAVVGTLLQLTWSGTLWHDNIITMPSGHGIILY